MKILIIAEDYAGFVPWYCFLYYGINNIQKQYLNID